MWFWSILNSLLTNHTISVDIEALTLDIGFNV